MSRRGTWDVQLTRLSDMYSLMDAYRIVSEHLNVPLVLAGYHNSRNDYRYELDQYAKRRYPYDTYQGRLAKAQDDVLNYRNQLRLF